MRDRAQHQFACQPHAADALDHHAHARIVDDRERIAVPRCPVYVARLVRIAHGDGLQEAGVGQQQPAGNRRTHDPAA